jgi:hypothetical protein
MNIHNDKYGIVFDIKNEITHIIEKICWFNLKLKGNKTKCFEVDILVSFSMKPA